MIYNRLVYLSTVSFSPLECELQRSRDLVCMVYCRVPEIRPRLRHVVGSVNMCEGLCFLILDCSHHPAL